MNLCIKIKDIMKGFEKGLNKGVAVNGVFL